jgi:CubicO group peptidase (beta-lactamase class C family)
MILISDIVEKVTGAKLDHLSNKYFYKPLGMKNTFFNPPQKLIERIAPTEHDNYFRHKLLKGVVHDENAYLLGGVSGHAGLFSTAEDIGIYSKMLIDDGYHLGTRYLTKNIIEKFTKRQNITEGSDRTLGWDTPSQNGNSSAGDYFSESSFGHLGFTGTSMWIDPENEIIVVLLTNRVYPTRNKENIKNRMQLFRREFHNQLMMEILKL